MATVDSLRKISLRSLTQEGRSNSRLLTRSYVRNLDQLVSGLSAMIVQLVVFQDPLS
jgi:hypothetical protein